MQRHQSEGNQRLEKKINSPFPPSGTFPLRIDCPAVGETCLSFTGLDT